MWRGVVWCVCTCDWVCVTVTQRAIYCGRGQDHLIKREHLFPAPCNRDLYIYMYAYGFLIGRASPVYGAGINHADSQFVSVSFMAYHGPLGVICMTLRCPHVDVVDAPAPAAVVVVLVLVLMHGSATCTSSPKPSARCFPVLKSRPTTAGRRFTDIPCYTANDISFQTIVASLGYLKVSCSLSAFFIQPCTVHSTCAWQRRETIGQPISRDVTAHVLFVGQRSTADSTL